MKTYENKKLIILKDYKESPYDSYEDYKKDMINYWREELSLSGLEINALLELTDNDIEKYFKN